MARRRRRVWSFVLATGFAAAGCALLLWLARPRVIDWRVDHHMPMIRERAEARGLPVMLVRAVVEIESGGRPRVRSERGAVGLMQITPITEKDVLNRNPDFARGDLTDPAYNLLIGTTYLQQMLQRFDGDLKLALAAYHMGPTAVAKGRREHPQLDTDALIRQIAGPKTRAYVTNVLREAGELQFNPEAGPEP